MLGFSGAIKQFIRDFCLGLGESLIGIGARVPALQDGEKVPVILIDCDGEEKKTFARMVKGQFIAERFSDFPGFHPVILFNGGSCDLRNGYVTNWRPA